MTYDVSWLQIIVIGSIFVIANTAVVLALVIGDN